MPTYDYKCKKCDNKFEVFQKMSDDPIARCPKCHGAVKRLIGSGSGIIFKGKGFYSTDYKKQSVTTNSPSTKKENTPNCSDCCSSSDGCPAKKAKEGE